MMELLAEASLRHDVLIKTQQRLVMQILDTAIAQLDYPGTRKLDGDWSVQGFGVLRLYIRKVARLHIWTTALRYPKVSLIHNHSWNLASSVVAGELRNTKFTQLEWEDRRGMPFNTMRLLTGYESAPLTDARRCRLIEYPGKVYRPGEVYAQAAEEIHQTDFLDGTVTLMHRTEDNNGVADVYWPSGESWGDAKPRKAKEWEIRLAIEHAFKWLQ